MLSMKMLIAADPYSGMACSRGSNGRLAERQIAHLNVVNVGGTYRKKRLDILCL